MVFNTIVNNISVIAWLSVLLIEETWAPRENHRPVACHWQTKEKIQLHCVFGKLWYSDRFLV